MEKYEIIFQPGHKIALVEKGKTVFAAAISAGIHINSSCGGNGACGKCKVILKKGRIQCQDAGKISPQEKKKGYYLACRSIPESNLEIEIPRESLLDSGSIIAEDISTLKHKDVYTAPEAVEVAQPDISGDTFLRSPLANKIFLELPRPTLDDKISDLDRIYRAILAKQDIPVLQTGLINIRRLGALLRSCGWKITATLGKRNATTEIVLIEPGDTSTRNFGLAFDIGTTTISGQLIDLNSGKILATRAAYNRQASFGSDVITRIIFAE